MRIFLSFIAIILIVGVCGCGSSKSTIATTPMKNFQGNLNGWKPQEFDPKNGILLIEKVKSRKNKEQKKIEAYLEKNYPYKYEFFDNGTTIEKIEMIQKYNDKHSYRFVLRSTFEVKIFEDHTSQSSRRSTEKLTGQVYLSQPSHIDSYDFYFTDRINNKKYSKSGISSSDAILTFKKIIENILK